MKRKTIAIDMDGVIADAVSHFISWYERDSGVKVEISVFDGVPEAEALPDGMVKKFVYTPGFFRTIPLMPGAQEALRVLMEHYDVYIVSAAMEFPQCLTEKREWLEEHFPGISWRNIIFCGDKSVIGTDYMIDDHVRNLDTFRGKGLMFHAGHNIHNESHTRMKTWEEILAFFEKEREGEGK